MLKTRGNKFYLYLLFDDSLHFPCPSKLTRMLIGEEWTVNRPGIFFSEFPSIDVEIIDLDVAKKENFPRGLFNIQLPENESKLVSIDHNFCVHVNCRTL